MKSEQIAMSVGQAWDASIVPALQRYIRIPNQSPLFDPDWKQNGHMNEAVALAKAWVEEQLHYCGEEIEIWIQTPNG